jgi:serine/threonine protein kinase/Tfp pilus assembly protein PilF
LSSGTGRVPGVTGLAGQVISHFRILEPVGRGGMGVVYKAQDTHLNRVVALKFLSPKLTLDSAAKERFLYEARAASSLDHPNICTIHEVGESADGRLYLAMPYYDGETLKERIESGPLPLAEALHLAVEAARGLACAHESGVMHRDIKPANLMITRQGQVKILDFGVAKLLGEAGLPRPLSALGTPAYMSPEQAQGIETDHRTDLWSLGVVLYQMLTGRLPFQGDTPNSTLLALTQDSPLPLRHGRDDLPEEVERVVTRALAKDPRERYRDANELIVDLQKVARSPRDAFPKDAFPSHTGPSALPLPRHRRWMAVAALCLLPLLAGLGWIGWRSPGRQAGSPGGSAEAMAGTAGIAKKAILVLPFENLGSPEDAYFSAGVTEEIISRLVGIHQLAVIAYSPPPGRSKDLRQVGRELGADYVLEGTVRWQHSAVGSRVRITPRLIRTADETHLWSESYDRVIDEIFSVQSEVAEEVIGQLDITLRLPEKERLHARTTGNTEAYEMYLRGRHLQQSPDSSPSGVRATIEAYERAVDLDPSFALAEARLSQAHSFAYHLAIDRTPERLARARQAAERALELQPDLPEGHLALVYYHYWGRRDYDAALEELKAVAEVRPNSAEVLEARGYILRRQGDHRGAVESFERAFALDPGKADLAYGIAFSYNTLREYGKAGRFFDRAIALSPESPAPYVIRGLNTLSQTGSVAEAIRGMDGAPRQDDPVFLFHRIWMDLYARDYEGALERIAQGPAEVLELQEYLYPRSLLRAYVQDLQGRHEAARASWEEAREPLEALVGKDPEDGRARCALGIVYAGLGRNAEAIREGRAALAAPSSNRDDYNLTAYRLQVAWIYSMSGKPEAALDQIEILLGRPSLLSAPLLRIDPRWDSLRSNPRFQKLAGGK